MSGAGDGFASYSAKLASYQARRRQVLQTNKAALFDALAAAGIATVAVAFDGSGDSGQIEDVAAFDAAGGLVVLPGGCVDVTDVDFDTLAPATAPSAVREAVEGMAYDLLGQVYAGWENGDGAHGGFTFAVADRTVTLDYNERYTATDFHQHEF